MSSRRSPPPPDWVVLPLVEDVPDCDVLLVFDVCEPVLLVDDVLLLDPPLPLLLLVPDEQATAQPRAVTERIERDKEIGLLII
jgi:hypothetical protein